MKNFKKVEAIVLDWAGTTVDFGCRAPLSVFLKIFREKGIPISVEEASQPMGLLKIQHFRELFKMYRIKNEYMRKYGKVPDEDTINEFYSAFEPTLLKILPDYSDPLPDVVETIEKLKKKYNIKIGSTTGYTKKMMKCIVPIAEQKGYKPDYIVTSSEVKQGRPYPWMMYQNAMNLGIFPMEHIVKVGDTVCDIMEGNNSGSWSVGVVEGSSLLGYTLDELKNADKSIIKRSKEKAAVTFNQNNADFVINSIKDLPEVIEKINERMNENGFPGSKFQVPPQPYILFTPGPLTTSTRVKLPMLSDWGSREDEYTNLVEKIRKELVNIALLNSDKKKYSIDYTSTIMQGSGTFGVESCLGSVIGKSDKLLIIVNGHYGYRIKEIAYILKIPHMMIEFDECKIPDLSLIDKVLHENKDITHVSLIHCETTTGILNPLEEISRVIKKHNKLFIVDAMSSFGGIPIDMKEHQIDYLISSSNKTLQGVPGISFVVARTDLMEKCKNNPRKSLSLDLYDQWKFLEKNRGSFRFTSPVHVIRAFDQALKELAEEGGVYARNKRYTEMQKILSDGMKEMNFTPLDLGLYQSPIITTFHTPKSQDFNFFRFYNSLKFKNCIIYPGKLTKFDSFRIGTIGNINSNDIRFLLQQVRESITWDKNFKH